MPRLGVSTGINMYYEEHGQHEGTTPVLFVRGTGADSSRWMSQVNEYVKRYHCVIFDNRGCGKSDTTDDLYTVSLMADDALALLDELGIESVHLSGLSLGGAIAQEMALKAPERIETLQLHGAWARTEGYAKLYFDMAIKLLDIGGTDLYYQGTILYLFSPDYFNDNPGLAETMLENMKANSSPLSGMRGQLHADQTHDTLDRLSEIDMPTLITVGEMDMCLPVSFSRQLHAAIPGSELVIFPGGSHLFGIQDPNAFNTVTLDWLSKHDNR
jgi:pimeloyl-ACP methyl ester carboxylesterase